MNANIDISSTVLRTERLVLRPWRMSDLEDFYAYASVDGVGQMAGWKPHESREESRVILENFIAGKKTFAIELEGRAVGSLGIERYDEERFPELGPLRCRMLGFVLAKEHWGKGLMPEAVREVLRYLFDELGMDAVLCGHFLSNARSARVQEKCGFRHYGYGVFETADGRREYDEMTIISREDFLRGRSEEPPKDGIACGGQREDACERDFPCVERPGRALEIEYAEVPAPAADHGEPHLLSDETMRLRMEKVLSGMRARSLDRLAVYCDAEHGYNFAYLTGFYTRFEEALMILDAEGGMTLVLGNENLNKAGSARFPCRAVHAPQFSLPDQPDAVREPMEELLRRAGIAEGQKVGLAGWKLFRHPGLFDVPSFIADAVRSAVGTKGSVVNATGIFIGDGGARTTNCADEIAHYEYGAALAWDCVLDAMDALEEGVSELELGDLPRVVWKEIRTAVLCGLALALICFGKILLVDRLLLGNSNITLLTAFVVCFTMAVTVLIAKIVGCTLPMGAKKLGFDPAVMASPFITTIVDALSLLVYFGIARALLPI